MSRIRGKGLSFRSCAASLFFLGICASCSLRAHAASDSDLGTTNQDQIQHFWRAVQASNGPVTVLAFGDSLAHEYISIQRQLFWRLQDHFGASGYAFSSGYYAALGGGAGWVQPNSNWWASHVGLPPGGYALTFSRSCDHLGLFWVGNPAGGSFTLSAFTNAGPVPALVLPLSGYASAAVGTYTNILVPWGDYSLRVDGISGTNAILGVQMLDASTRGVSVAFMAEDGQSLGGILGVSTNILYPILCAVNPQLVVWHMKEVSDLASTLVLSNALLGLESLWQATVTNGDVVYLGTPHDSTDSAPLQNPVVRYAAVRDRRAYVDCMTPCVSYQCMVTNYLMFDATHPNDVANSFLANTVVWPQLGLGRLEQRQPFSSAALPANPTWLPRTARTPAVYGWACSTPEEASLVLYNLSSQAGNGLVDCQNAFSLPPGASAIYDVHPAYAESRSPVSVLYSGQVAPVTLNGTEIVALEANARASYTAQALAAGPLAYWRLGESNGLVAADLLGANPGQYVAATLHVMPGALAQQDDGAVQLDGTGSHVLIANGLPFNFPGTNAFTLTAWVKVGALGGVQRFFSNRDDANGSGYALGLSGDGHLVFTAFGVGDFTGTNSPAIAGQWYHAAVVRRANNLECYWNGACVGMAALGPMGSSAASLQLGGNPAPAPAEEPFTGQLDEAAVFGTALTPDQIAALYQSQSVPVYPPVILTQPVAQSRLAGCEAFFAGQGFGTPALAFQWLHEGQPLPGATDPNLLLTQLAPAMAGNYSFFVTNAAGAVTSAPAALTISAPPGYMSALLPAQPGAYWRLDEGEGPTVLDSWGTNNGTASGNVQFLQFGALPYTYQTCVGFDGRPGTQIDVPYSPGLNPPTFTVELWAQAATATNGLQSPLASRDTSPASGYFFQVTADQHWAFQLGAGAGGWQTNLGPAVVPGKWTFLAGTFDGTNQCLYIDGQLAARAPASLAVNTRRPLRLGAGDTECSGGEYFAGKLDEVVLFPYALSPEQVVQHYQAAFQSPPATRLSLQLVGPTVVLLWPTGQVEHADSMGGPWAPLSGAVSPMVLAPTGSCHFYRLAPH